MFIRVKKVLNQLKKTALHIIIPFPPALVWRVGRVTIMISVRPGAVARSLAVTERP